MVLTAFTRPVETQNRQIPSVVVGEPEIPSLAEELLAVDSC